MVNETMFHLLLEDRVLINSVVVDDSDQVTLSEDQGNGLLCLNFSDLLQPAFDAFEGSGLIRGDTDHKDVCTLVLRFTVHVKMLVAGCVLNDYFKLKVVILILHLTFTLVDVEYGWLVIIGEVAVEIISDEA